MATDNQLRARLSASHAERLDQFAEELDNRSEAERKAVEEGLAELGYLDRPREAHELFLWYTRRIGLSLGFLGVGTIGVGIFSARIVSLVGFGLTVGGFLLIAVEEFLGEIGTSEGPGVNE